jgi:hypothetical protein
MKLFCLLTALLISVSVFAQPHGTVVTEKLTSAVLKENLTGLDPVRTVMIYLPPGYEKSRKSYPVLYYCHSMFGTAQLIMEGTPIVELLERAFQNNVIKEMIVVVADYSSPTVGSLYENSPVSGRWLDFTTQELVPFIDKKFRTIPRSASRAVTGDFMGGRGALKLGMTHADIFGTVYAMHPVATGTGYLPWTELGMDWKQLLNAKSASDLGVRPRDARVNVFITICQAYLPNPSRPPFYCDFFMDLKDGVPVVNVENMIRAKKGFQLEETLRESVGELKKLRGLAFDWAAYDGNFDHVFSARVLSRDLDDIGIPHEAEEYNGTPWNKNWKDDGRFYTRVLPFISRHLMFE